MATPSLKRSPLVLPVPALLTLSLQYNHYFYKHNFIHVQKRTFLKLNCLNKISVNDILKYIIRCLVETNVHNN